MAHGAPGVLGIRAKGRGAVLANHQARCCPSKSEVDQAVFIDGGLDRICRAVLVQSQGQVVRADRVHFLIEEVVVQGIRMPNVRGVGIGREDLGIERDGRVHSSVQKRQRQFPTMLHSSASNPGSLLLRNVVVDDLQKGQIAIVTHSVKGLRLDRGVLRSLPF